MFLSYEAFHTTNNHNYKQKIRNLIRKLVLIPSIDPHQIMSTTKYNSALNLIPGATIPNKFNYVDSSHSHKHTLRMFLIPTQSHIHSNVSNTFQLIGNERENIIFGRKTIAKSKFCTL